MASHVARSVINVTELFHLSGGLRAGTSLSGQLLIFPTTENKCVELSVAEKSQYLSVVSALGLDVLGYESISQQNGLRHSSWQLFDPNQPHGHQIIDTWKHIAFSAANEGNSIAATVAKNISFSLRASSLRLRDVSNQYHFQNVYAALNRIKPGSRFMNVETFDTYLSLHSLLVEMCSARDHLARFLSPILLPGRNVETTMGGLYKRIKSFADANPVKQMILRICDKNQLDAWMVRLGYFRDLIVHQAPIINFAERYVTGRPLTTDQHTLLSIRVGVPRDPITALDEDYVDALGHFRQLLIKLLQFSRLVAQHSGINPVIPHIDLSDTARATPYPYTRR